MSTTYSVIEHGEHKKVKISDDGFGLSIYVMKNGEHWNGVSVDTEMLTMIAQAITEYFEINDN